MMLMMLALSVCVVSCGDDEENINLDEIGNFYIEYNAQGGGLNAADLNSIKSQLASEYGSYLNGVETKQAIYVFQELVKQIRDAEVIMGSGEKILSAAEEETKKKLRG